MSMPCDASFHAEKIHPSAYIAPGAVVAGQVTIGSDASLWFGAVIRGDVETVSVGDKSNIQDNCILHSDIGAPCIIGKRVTVGHGAIIHSAIVEDEVLIGMGATVLDRAHIGSHSIIAAGAVITPGTVIPENSLVMGIPGRVVRQTTEKDTAEIIKSAEHYCDFAREYKKNYVRP
ncbi:MAG: gamma carbonic anhydrase family protein [Chitinispirillaceae bacterium]|jgi:carbonic anhydrase/acetyltransferase-like protein (isoleucine patch superfamily)|nr:gamma carbonic anhydrase family protein [Chitinispirillaceae bacterium]